MTDETERNINQPDNQEDESLVPVTHGTDDIDVEGALAAVSSLNELARDTDEATQNDDKSIEQVGESDYGVKLDHSTIEPVVATEPITPFERVERPLQNNAEVPVDDPIYHTDFPHPPPSVLYRGQIASVVPALLLIAIGVYLTIMLTTSDVVLTPALIAAILLGGCGTTLLAYWLSSSRWSVGSFFIGSALILMGAVGVYMLLPNTLDITAGWPLLFTAIGAAFVLTDLFVPSGRRFWFVGLVLAVAGLGGVSVTSDLVQLQMIGGLWPIVAVTMLIVLIAPLLRRQD